jgi:DNA repair photolyase
MPQSNHELFDFWHKAAVINLNEFRYKSLSNWACNISVGCSHACRFCYVPSTPFRYLATELADYQVKDPDEQWGQYSLLRPWDKEKFLASLRAAENTSVKKLKKDGNRAVIFCSTTDPYQVFNASTPEKTKQLNDAALQLVENALRLILNDSTLNVRILTRSPRARKHFKLYQEFGNRLMFGMSIPTLNNELARIYEPNAPAPTQRLKTLQEAKDAGLNVYVTMAPTYPECDETDLRKTLTEIKKLKPLTIFHEPINVRAENVARIEAHAKELGVKVNTAVFATDQSWLEYAMDSLLMMQRLANEMDLIHCLHLWPDEDLAIKSHFLAILANQRTNLTPYQKRREKQKDEKYYDEKYKPWIESWWNRVSEWPGKGSPR